jgi:hypothetical protein
MKCPHCGRESETQQQRAAESRWAGMTATQRAAEMSRVRKIGVKRAKTKARGLRQNEKLTRDAGSAGTNATKSPNETES